MSQYSVDNTSLATIYTDISKAIRVSVLFIACICLATFVAVISLVSKLIWWAILVFISRGLSPISRLFVSDGVDLKAAFAKTFLDVLVMNGYQIITLTV